MGGACDKVEHMLQKVATIAGNLSNFSKLFDLAIQCQEICKSVRSRLTYKWLFQPAHFLGRCPVSARVKLLGKDGTFCLFKIC